MMNKVSVSISGIKIQLQNKQSVELYTAEREQTQGAVIIKGRIYRQDIEGASVYYIYDDDGKLIVVRDDEREIEKAVESIKKALVEKVAKRFNIQNPTVRELDDGIHIEDLKKVYVSNSVAVYYGREVVIPWSAIISAVFANKKAKKRLTEEEIEKIVEMYKEGVSMNQIAKKLGISIRTVYTYLKKLGLKQ